MEGSTPSRVQILDAGPRGAANLEAMSALSTGKRGKLCFFKGDEGGTPIGSHTVFDFSGHQQNVGMVQTWNQCQQMVLTTEDKPESLLLMDTETGSTLSELEMRRQQRNWKLSIDSVTPMQKFEQYKATNEYSLFGLGDGGKTVFALNHDSRAGENVEEFIIRADSSRKYKSYTFTCHAQTRAGNLALGRTDGGVALYDAIMQSENASCVLDGMPGPVTSLDVAADGSMIVWTTPEFVFFSSPSEEHWTKGKKVDGGATVPDWMSVRFDAGTARDEHGLAEREIITYCGSWQVRWSVSKALKAWQLLDNGEGQGAAPFYGVATEIGGPVFRHVTVKDDLDVVALEGEIVKSLRF